MKKLAKYCMALPGHSFQEPPPTFARALGNQALNRGLQVRLDRMTAMVDARFICAPFEDWPFWVPLDPVDGVVFAFNRGDERLSRSSVHGSSGFLWKRLPYHTLPNMHPQDPRPKFYAPVSLYSFELHEAYMKQLSEETVAGASSYTIVPTVGETGR